MPTKATLEDHENKQWTAQQLQQAAAAHGDKPAQALNMIVPRGRPALAPELAQTSRIAERVTQAQLAEYQARGGKTWLVRELGRKARP